MLQTVELIWLALFFAEVVIFTAGFGQLYIRSALSIISLSLVLLNIALLAAFLWKRDLDQRLYSSKMLLGCLLMFCRRETMQN